jgi:Na+/proline symporter
MNNDQVISKSNPRGKAIASLVLGIIGLISSIFALYFPMAGVSMIILFGSVFIVFLGLILGIIGLRSNKKRLAILGMTLCIITLVLILNAFGFLGARWSFPIAPSAF